MARIDEIAPDLYRVSIYMPQFDLQFNHFLIKDDEPLLFHTGMRRMFPEVRDAVAQVIDPAALRWISWSHFEVDECGALNEWLTVAPRAHLTADRLGARDRQGRGDRNGRTHLPVCADAALATWLGRRGAVRRENGCAPLLRPVPSDWGRRAGHVR